MNYKQIYRAKIENLFEDQHHSIIQTVIWLNKHYDAMPPDFKEANRELSDRDKNNILRDATYPF